MHDPLSGEAFLAAIVTWSADAIIGKRLDGIITSWNASAERLYGYTAAEAIGKSIELLAPDDRPDEIPAILERVSSGQPVPAFETVRVRKDGKPVEVRLSVSPVRAADGTIIGAASIARDISSAKRLERELTESREHAHEILESISDAFYALDAEWRFTYVNARTEQLWGRRREELVGHSIWEVFPHALGGDTHRQHVLAAQQRQSRTYETISPILDYWIEVSIYPGKAGGLSVYFHDISARKDAEAEQREALERAEGAFKDAQEALRLRHEVLAAVSHDLKGPLTAIRCTSQVAERMLRSANGIDADFLCRDMQRIQRASMRMSEWIDELLDVAQLEAGQDLRLHRSPNDLAAVVAEGVSEAALQTPHRTVRFNVPDQAVVGYWDAARLRRVFDNLLSNAFKYSPDDAPVDVQLTTEQRDGMEWAKLMVTDYGAGIAAEDIPHLFEYLWRSKTESERVVGAGIGLAGARRIVLQHGGEIEVRSQQGAGSGFTVWLPLRHDRAASAAA
jgi:PAS domain S-box-containing protein